MSDHNLFAPPQSQGGSEHVRSPRRRRPIWLVVRLLIAVIGLWLLLGPERSAPNGAVRNGQVFARAIGGIVALLATFPFGRPRREQSAGQVAEEL